MTQDWARTLFVNHLVPWASGHAGIDILELKTLVGKENSVLLDKVIAGSCFASKRGRGRQKRTGGGGRRRGEGRENDLEVIMPTPSSRHSRVSGPIFPACCVAGTVCHVTGSH